VPSGKFPDNAATISVDVADTTVSGIRSSVTTGGAACPDPFAGHEKFWPVITRWLFDSSNAALVITSCGAGAAAAIVTCAHTISAASPRTVVDHRFESDICDLRVFHR
jgi:hypothetical protein